MKLVHFVVAAVLGQLCFSQEASVPSLSPTDLQSLVAEVLEWKNSDAGKTAASIEGLMPTPAPMPAPTYVNGSTLSPSHLAGRGVTYAELVRFQASKQAVAQLAKEQPLATFSTATPFALMTTEEFAKWVSRGNVTENRRRLEQQRNLQESSNLASNNGSGSGNADSTDEEVASAPAPTDEMNTGSTDEGVASAQAPTDEMDASPSQGQDSSTSNSAEEIAASHDIGTSSTAEEIVPTTLPAASHDIGTSSTAEEIVPTTLPAASHDIGTSSTAEEIVPTTLPAASHDIGTSSTAEEIVPTTLPAASQAGAMFGPSTVDWQRYGCVTRVKNQGNCGSCWVFAAVAALESGYCIHSKPLKLVELSELEAGTCSVASNKNICNGGYATWIFNSVIRKYHGVCTSASVPYVIKPNIRPRCPFDTKNYACDMQYLPVTKISAARYPDHTVLEKVVAKQPVVAQVHAGVRYFQYYKGGVLKGNEKQCSSSKIDHEVMIVGYGNTGSTKYWRIKNSWGTAWGEKGYLRLERGYQGAKYGACAVEKYVYYPIFRNPMLNKQCLPLERHTNYPGNDISRTQAYTPGECCDKCSNSKPCGAYTWTNSSSGTCYLKRIRGTKLQRTPPRPDGSAQAVSGEVYKCQALRPNVYFQGGDIKSVRTGRVSDCCSYCRATSKCAAFSWRNGMCFLKKNAFKVVSKKGFVSARV